MNLPTSYIPKYLAKKLACFVVTSPTNQKHYLCSPLIEKDKFLPLTFLGFRQLIAAGNIVKKKKVPAVARLYNPLVTQGNEYYFRVSSLIPFQGNFMARYAFNKLGAKKASIRSESPMICCRTGQLLQAGFVKRPHPNAVVEISNYQTGDNDFLRPAVPALNPKTLISTLPPVTLRNPL
jgi:branched-chain amino acid transport system substrate-binding protein